LNEGTTFILEFNAAE